MNIRLQCKEKDIYCLLYAVILACIVLLGAGSLLMIEKPGALHFSIAIGMIILLTGIRILPAKGRLLSLLFLASFLCIAVLTTGLQKSLSFLRGYFLYLTGRGEPAAEWIMGYELLQATIISLLCYFLQILLEKFYPCKAVLAALFFGGLMFCLFTKKQLTHMEAVFILFYTVTTCVEGLQLRWDKIRNKDPKAHMIWIMPFMAVYFILMLLTPAPQKPYDWQFVKSAYRQVKESFLSLTQNLWGTDYDFGVSLSGFSEDGNLGGSLQRDDREVMTIQGEDDLRTNVYLTGRIYDTFDGRQWLQNNHDTSSDYHLDTMETLHAVQNYNRGVQRDYIYRTTLHISYRFLNTTYLFAPLKTESVMKDHLDLTFTCDGGSLLFPGKKRYGTEYETTYYQLNADSEEFYQFLEDASSLDKPAFGMTEESLQRIERIYDIYLDEVTLSDEMKKYLDEITKDAENDIDRLRLIEKELSSFTYTENPGSLPDTVTGSGEFLDYFLLESRQGYCTYFATAFVLLARSEGIPARYVQGFCIPADGSREVTAYSYMAHTWPEVYIDNVGWIPFEPTPGYAGIRYTPWKTSQSILHIPSDPESYRPENSTENNMETLPETSTEQEMQKHDGRILKITAYTLLTVLAVCAILLILDHIVKKRRYRKMTLPEKFLAEISYNLQVLSRLGLRRNTTETLQEFQERSARLMEQSGDTLKFLEYYEMLLYGKKEITTETIEEARQEREVFLTVLKEKRPIRFYLFIIVRRFFPFTYS